MQGLVDQALLGLLAHLDLLAQLADRGGQFARAVLHAALEFRLQLLAFQRGHDVLGHVGQQGAVLGGVVHAGLVGLHHHRAAHAAFAHHRHAQEIQRRRAQADAARHVQRLRHLARGAAHRLAVADQPQRQAVAQAGGGDFAVGLVDVGVLGVGEVDEAHAVALGVVEGDVEIARVHQLADHKVDAPEHVLHAKAAAGQVGDAVQRGLQLLAALALQHFLGERAGALLDPALQFVVRLAAGQRDQDVLGHELQQGQVLLGVAVRVLVALHHDRAARHAFGQHRHAQPVGALRPVHRHVDVQAQRAPQLPRRPQRGAAGVDHRQGQAVADLGCRVFLQRIDRAVVAFVGEVDEAHAVARVVVQGDQEVRGIHQLADHVVDLPQHVGHLQPGRRKVGDLEQGGLQARVLLQPMGGEPLRAQLQRRAHPCGDHGQEVAPCRCRRVGTALRGPLHGEQGIAGKLELAALAATRGASCTRWHPHHRFVARARACRPAGTRVQAQVAQAEARLRLARRDALDLVERRSGEQRRHEVAARSGP